MGYYGTGSYDLSSGTLAAPNEYIGGTSGAVDTFTQSGGTNTATTINIYNGAYNLSGGTLDVDTINLMNGTADLNITGGTLSFDTFTGDLDVGANATLSPGNSPGFMDIYGDYSNTGTLEIEIGGTTPGTELDQVRVYGGDIYMGGTIYMIEWDDYAYQKTDEYTILTWEEGYNFIDNGYTLTATFSSKFEANVVGNSLVLNYTGGQPVPELPTGMIPVLGIILGFAVKKMRRK